MREALGSAAPEPELELKRRLREAESAGERRGGWAWVDGVLREDGRVGLRGRRRGGPRQAGVGRRPCLVGGPGPARGSRGAGPGPHSHSPAPRHLPRVAATADGGPEPRRRRARGPAFLSNSSWREAGPAAGAGVAGAGRAACGSAATGPRLLAGSAR